MLLSLWEVSNSGESYPQEKALPSWLPLVARDKARLKERCNKLWFRFLVNGHLPGFYLADNDTEGCQNWGKSRCLPQEKISTLFWICRSSAHKRPLWSLTGTQGHGRSLQSKNSKRKLDMKAFVSHIIVHFAHLSKLARV